MLIPSPCYFIIAALIGLFGFYHVFRACIQKSRRLILWWHIVLLMALVTAYVITISVLFVYWLRSTSHSLFLALFQLAWMGELSIQVCSDSIHLEKRATNENLGHTSSDNVLE